MNLEEKIAQAMLEKIAQVAKERNLSEEEVDKLIEASIERALPEGIKKMADNMVAQLTSQIPEMIEQERGLQIGFEQRLYDRWGKALDLFDATVILTRESGERFLKKHQKDVTKEEKILIEALARIHIRSCQTMSAISILLKSGFARDAMARQRTLHELAVVASIIKKHGPSLAERFLLHEVIETYKSAAQYETKYARLGAEPPDPNNLAQLQARRDELCLRFGENFKNDNGWVVEIIGKKKPTFEDLEKEAQLDHLRPYYRMAGFGIHATSKGMVFDIGSIKSPAGGPRGLLAGASNAGLTDPGHGSLLSLNVCTVCLLTCKTDVEALVTLQTLTSFVDEAGKAFLAIHLEQVEEEKLLREDPHST